MGNILITGGQLYNKGAQSMTFITVNELKKRFPDKKIILASYLDYDRSEEEKRQYSFSIEHTDCILLGSRFYRSRYAKNASKEDIEKSAGILEKTDCIIDISGYALGSNWKLEKSVFYILRIMVAKKYKIRYYIMPQSFGPFNYAGIKGMVMNNLIKKYLQYPQVIYAREKEGYDLLTGKYKLNNVRMSTDLVLLNKEIDLHTIYTEIPPLKTADITGKNNVAIVPNMKNFVYGNKTQVVDVYRKIVDKLLSMHKKVYLLRHSAEDSKACEIIKDMFAENEDVVLLSDEFSCFEYDHLVGKFDYIIASRFHSIVHAYKNGIPCIALGWAVKYHELLHTFEQDTFIFDVRSHLDFDPIAGAIDRMNDTYQSQSAKIRDILKEMQTHDIYDALESKE